MVGHVTGGDVSITSGMKVLDHLVLAILRGLFTLCVFLDMRHLRTVQCDMFSDKNMGMKTGHEKEEDKRGKHRPRWDRRVMRSLGDEESVDPKERVAAECQEENTCEWSQIYDENE